MYKRQTQYGGITAPGNAPWVITVGAASHQGTTRRSDDSIASFSSRGPTWIDFAAKPDLVAPGVGIESLADPHSTLYSELADYRLSGTRETPFEPYLSLSGTSMAAPVVTGAIALMLEANPNLTPNAIKAILEFTAEHRANESALAQGAGFINVHGAIRMAKFFRQPTTGGGLPGDTIEDEFIAWSTAMQWGNYRVTGGTLLPGMNAWSPAVTWGTFQTRNGNPVVWGTSDRDNIVWSTAARENIVWSTAARDNIVWSTAARENIVWSTAGADNIVWSTGDRENIVWSTRDSDNIVWSTAYAQNVVWGTDCDGRDCTRTIWGANSNGVTWGTARDADNIVWSTVARDADNIVWSTAARDADNIVWSTIARDADNIVWSTSIPAPVLWPAPAVITNGRRVAAGK